MPIIYQTGFREASNFLTRTKRSKSRYDIFGDKLKIIKDRCVSFILDTLRAPPFLETTVSSVILMCFLEIGFPDNIVS